MRLEIDESTGLRILHPAAGLVLFNVHDKERTYHDVVYMAKNDSLSDYAEVSIDYAYGYSQDGTINDILKMIEAQSGLLDYFVMNSDMTLFGIDMELAALVNYLVMRITIGRLKYDDVIAKYPSLQDDIDLALKKR